MLIYNRSRKSIITFCTSRGVGDVAPYNRIILCVRCSHKPASTSGGGGPLAVEGVQYAMKFALTSLCTRTPPPVSDGSPLAEGAYFRFVVRALVGAYFMLAFTTLSIYSHTPLKFLSQFLYSNHCLPPKGFVFL